MSRDQIVCMTLLLSCLLLGCSGDPVESAGNTDSVDVSPPPIAELPAVPTAPLPVASAAAADAKPAGLPSDVGVPELGENAMRFATFNMALNRRSQGALVKELKAGSQKASKLATIVQIVRPHVLLVNEIDFDEEHESVELLHSQYFDVAQDGTEAISYPHRYTAEVNTGVPSEVDMDNDGNVGGTGDCFGFGSFPGQYGMAVYSQFPIEDVRTFQKLLWSKMPDAALPSNEDGSSYYSTETLESFRISSKSHWDVSLETPRGTIHFLVCHPTPPVFDGPEDRNGRRNSDEIRLFADYVTGGDACEYLVDDQGKSGGLTESDSFVVAGDLNADPQDGASYESAINQLLEHPRVQAVLPSSKGAVEAAAVQGGKNLSHKSDAAYDTGDFNDRSVGNLRADYVLPSTNLTVLQTGVFWPTSDNRLAELAAASDHRIVWLDVAVEAAEGDTAE